MVQFNIAYWAERELAAACVGRDVRFVADHKESNWSPSEISNRVKFFSDAIGQFEGDAVAVYNEVTKQILTSAGVAEPRRVHSLGSARA